MPTPRSRPSRAGPRRALPAAVAVALAGCAAPAPVHHPAANAIGPYSAMVEAGGLLFLSGKIGPQGGSFADEVAGCLTAIEGELARVGLTLADAVSVNVFLTDMALFDALNEVYAARFPAPPPARTTVAVAALPKGARVEIQVVARRG